MIIRKAQKNDAKQIIPLIDKIYKEYGDFVNTNKYDKDLLDLEKYYFSKGGFFWVCEINKKIVGTIAVLPKNKVFEIKRMYVEKSCRGKGIADKLLQTALQWGKNKGFEKVYLWSDTRFERGHNFYLKHGFKKGQKRKMNDANYPYEEFYFEMKI